MTLEADVASCKACGARHHPDCWLEGGACGTCGRERGRLALPDDACQGWRCGRLALGPRWTHDSALCAAHRARSDGLALAVVAFLPVILLVLPSWLPAHASLWAASSAAAAAFLATWLLGFAVALGVAEGLRAALRRLAARAGAGRAPGDGDPDRGPAR